MGQKPSPLLPTVYKCAFLWSGAGHTATNVLHFLQATGDESSLFADLGTSVTAGMWTSVCSTARIANVEITRLDRESATQSFSTTGTQWAGSAIGTDFDPAVATLVSTKTGFRGQASHGRIFLPFTDSALTVTGTIPSATETAMQTAWTTFITTTNSSGIPLQVTSYGIFVENPPGTWQEVAVAMSRSVTTVNVKTACGTIRRRQGRVVKSFPTILELQSLRAQVAGQTSGKAR